MKLLSVSNEEELSRIAAEILFAKIKSAKKLVLGLATGKTPLGMYRYLSKYSKESNQTFRHIHTVNLDEYVGSITYHEYMEENLFQHIDIPKDQTHIPDGEAENLTEECRRYEQLIKEIGGIDLQVLGIGENGHIGFNEPGTSFDARTHVVELTESTLKANAKYFVDSEQPKQAITMGIGTILESREILLLAIGERKANAVKELFKGSLNKDIPATALINHPHVTVLADKGARKLLDKES
ncbi:glucosamine-6-phosphate deaminase [Fictibacillus phosphorivorans]|uniref:glucosamine-6-phosphate deaminase n=1 Tax=Fictibacillus phosphorivorans TaxID=1221500 RepID=UPI00203EE8B5|nr:glucosamine-6-phosphate deaminase [Fictibacillus phosphorivorans]MCM3718699.1 glucosamine-6-phosphate deaminase [Fictibacillus phosphorivorans]MCM3776322.1 glucosamine-6-phosphate deaminase [Fictibacillus phosphorivorans]